MEEFNQNSNYMITAENLTIFPYRPIPLPPMVNAGFDTGYIPNFMYRPTELSGPLDLSLRGPVPITPPTTPSPLGKRLRSECDVNESNHNQKGPSPSPSSEISVTDEDLNDFVDITGENDSEDDEVIVDSNDSIDVEENPGILENGKSTFENPEQHNRAVEGFARLFDQTLIKTQNSNFRETVDIVSDSLNGSENSVNRVDNEKQVKVLTHRVPKSEKKKFKTRKHLVDDDNSSPLSGIIIRKLRDDEELVVRKVRCVNL